MTEKKVRRKPAGRAAPSAHSKLATPKEPPPANRRSGKASKDGASAAAGRKPAPARARNTPWQIAVSSRQSLIRIRAPAIRRIVEAVFCEEEVVTAEISVAIVDDATIHAINRDFLQHDYPTDVISFLLEDTELPASSPRRNRSSHTAFAPPRGRGKTISGEVVISAETALRSAEDYGWEARHELALYLVHGLLHLCGYDDLTRVDQRAMRRRETEILAKLGLVPRYTEPA